jgi:hypothetical protein
MGTWGNGILDNDTSSDIYGDFIDFYNEGQDPKTITEKLLNKNQYLIENPDDCTNFWFALALAQWETKSLNKTVFDKVKDFIENDIDLAIWKELEASESEIRKRKLILQKFLEKLKSERIKPKPRKKQKPVIAKPIYSKGTCLTFKLENGNYGGDIVLEEKKDLKFGGQNYIATTRMNQASKPTIDDMIKSEVVITSYFQDIDLRGEILWYPSKSFEEYNSIFETIGVLRIDKKYTYGGIGTRTTAGWDYIKMNIDRQIEFEKNNPRPKVVLKSIDYIKKKRWWNRLFS